MANSPASSPLPQRSRFPLRRLPQLDGLRGFTATYVVFHNWAGSSDTLPFWLQKGLLSFGQEAVMVFFLLSGFVMYWSSIDRPKQTFYQFFVRRFRRIYFPFVSAMVLVFAIAVAQKGVVSVVQHPKFFSSLLGNLAMTQEISTLKPGTWSEPFLGNLPFWTLTYEWWLYFLFFPIYRFFLQHPWRIPAITLFSLVNFLIYTQIPNLISLVCTYLILWWSGVELAIQIRRDKLSWTSLSPILMAIALMATLTFAPVLNTDTIRLGFYPFVIFRHFTVVLIFLGLGKLWYQHRPKIVDTILRPFAIVSPISYALYLFHYPILVMWNPKIFTNSLWVIIPIKFILLIGLSYLVEVYLQRRVNRILR